jgi:hypothetical protein
MGTGYAGRGYPLGHTDPSPAFAQGWDDGAALGGAPRPSAVRPCAHQRRRIAGHPDHRRRLPRQVGRSVRSARPMSAAGVGKCRRRCPQEVHAAARCCRPWPRRRNGRAARRRRGRIHRERTRVRRAVPRRAADCRQPQPLNRRETAERVAQKKMVSETYAWAVEQARGRSARHRLPPPRRHGAALTSVHSLSTLAFARASHAATCTVGRCALAPARPSVERDNPSLPLLSAPPSVRATVLRRRSSTHSEGRFVVTRTHVRMHCECTFLPTRPDLRRGVAGQTSHGGDAGGASPRTARRGVYIYIYIYIYIYEVRPLALRVGGFLGVFFLAEGDCRAFPVSNKPPRNDRTIGVCSLRRSRATLPGRRGSRAPRRRSWTPRPSTSCVSSRLAAAAARRRLCGGAPRPPESSVRGSTRVPWSTPHAGVLDYPWSTHAAEYG